MQLHTAASTLFNKFKGQLCHPDTCTFTFRLLQQSQYFCWVDFVILDNVAQHVDRGQIWAFQRTTQVLTSKISASSSNGIIHESTVNFTFKKICYISLSVALRKSDIFYHCDYCEAWQNLGWSVYLIKINVKPKCWKKPCVHACYIQLTTTVYGWWRTGHQRPTPNMRCPIRTWTQWQAANCQQILLTATRILELTWGFAHCQRISVAIRPWSLRQAFTSCWVS